MPPVGAARDDRADRWLRHFVDSAAQYHEYLASNPDRRGIALSRSRGPCQIEKDERFWVAATFMTVVRQPEPNAALEPLLAFVYGEQPPIAGLSSWSELLHGPLHLYFEANLPSPRGYLDAVSDRIHLHPVEYVRQAARRTSSDSMRETLEGATNVDALLVAEATGFGLVVEAKVLSDVSHDVSFDPCRNQIARNVDVMLETNDRLPMPLSARRPDRTFFLLVTPRIFVENWTTRLYGWLMRDYGDTRSNALGRDLAHRSAADLARVPARIGWTSWERIGSLIPGSAPWLATADTGTDAAETGQEVSGD